MNEEIKVSELDLADEIRDTDQLMIVQGGINKKAPGEKINDRTISDSYGISEKKGYSQRYQNEHNVIVSPTESTTGERVWFKQGKNLFNKNNSTIKTLYPGSNGSTTSGELFKSVLINCKPNTTYAIKRFFYESTDIIAASYSSIPVVNSSWTNRVVGTTSNVMTITTGANDLYLLIYIYYGNTAATLQSTLDGLMVQFGDTITSYEAYIATSINVDGEEIYSQAEIGENSNGKYIKYADGTMICSGIKSFTGADFTTQNGSVYIPATSPSINFSQQFIENPVVTLTAFNRANGVYESGLSTSLVAIWPFAFSSITNVNYSIHYIAIGRWK